MVARRRRVDTFGQLELPRPLLRGRQPVRADHRLRTDEKHIRTQSAILDKTSTLCLLLTVTVFSVRMCSSSVQKTRLARAARRFWTFRRCHLGQRLGTSRREVRLAAATQNFGACGIAQRHGGVPVAAPVSY